jgi:hypothetical protein
VTLDGMLDDAAAAFDEAVALIAAEYRQVRAAAGYHDADTDARLAEFEVNWFAARCELLEQLRAALLTDADTIH